MNTGPRRDNDIARWARGTLEVPVMLILQKQPGPIRVPCGMGYPVWVPYGFCPRDGDGSQTG